MLKRGINILEMSMLSYNKSKKNISYSCMAVHIGKTLFCLAAKDLRLPETHCFHLAFEFCIGKGKGERRLSQVSEATSFDVSVNQELVSRLDSSHEREQAVQGT